MEEATPTSARKKGHDIVRAYKRKQQIRSLAWGLGVGLLMAAIVGGMLWFIYAKGR